MPRSVVPVVLDNRVQHLGRMYVNNLRAAHRLPLGTSDSIFPNRYTSVCATRSPTPLPQKNREREREGEREKEAAPGCRA